MSPKPAPPPWITYFAVEGRSQRRSSRSSWATRATGQVATRCHHPDCADGDIDGHLLGIDVVMAVAERRAWAHSATHQPTDKAS